MPRIPFAKVAHIMALGNCKEASRSSSDMWAPASGPMKHHIGVASPTRQDRPIEFQPPPSLRMRQYQSCISDHITTSYWNSVKTFEAGAWSAIIQRVIRKAKKPNTCKNRIMPSASGRCCAKNMLKPTVRTTNRNTIRVVFHRVDTSASG